MAPLERLKILMQVQGNEKIYRSTWQVRQEDCRGGHALVRSPPMQGCSEVLAHRQSH